MSVSPLSQFLQLWRCSALESLSLPTPPWRRSPTPSLALSTSLLDRAARCHSGRGCNGSARLFRPPPSPGPRGAGAPPRHWPSLPPSWTGLSAGTTAAAVTETPLCRVPLPPHATVVPAPNPVVVPAPHRMVCLLRLPCGSGGALPPLSLPWRRRRPPPAARHRSAGAPSRRCPFLPPSCTGRRAATLVPAVAAAPHVFGVPLPLQLQAGPVRWLVNGAMSSFVLLAYSLL